MSEETKELQSWQRFNVVQGILTYQGQILLVGNDYGYENLTWSLPGGRLEPGEQHPTALVREFQEETGLTVISGEMLYLVDARSQLDWRHYITAVFSVRPLTESLNLPLVNCTSDATVKQVRFVPFSEAATLLRSPSLGEPLLNYLYQGEALERRYWAYPEYLRADWLPLEWPPSSYLQIG